MLQNSLCCPQNPNGHLLLQPTLTTSPHPLSSPLSHFISSPSGSASLFNLLPLRTTRKFTPCLVSCSAFRKGGIAKGYQRRPVFRWKDMYKRVTLLENPETGVSGLLNQCEIEGKTFEKSELYMFVKNLRKFRRYKLALEVCEWICDRAERFELSSSDMAIKLDLIAKVHGIPSAEDFFTRIPDFQKDKRVYGALLNAYVEAKEKDRAEMLMETMRSKRVASFPLSFNNMMTLYMKLKEYSKVEWVISEMKKSKIRLDVYSYNIWLSARGSAGSVTGLEEVLGEMEKDQNVSPSWSTFSSMAAWFLRLGELEKAKDCLKSLEMKIDGQDRSPYHYLLNLHGRLDDKEEVYRVWSIYKSQFQTMTNWGYHSVIHSLLQAGDIEGAEKIYNEWFSVKTAYDPRISNILLRWYVKEGQSEKVESFFAHMEKDGGKLFPSTWEIRAEQHMKERRIPDALASFRQAKNSGQFRPKPVNISSFLELCEQEGDRVSKEEMLGLLRELGFSEDEIFRPLVTQHVGADSSNNTYQLQEDYTSHPRDEIEWSGNEDSEMLLPVV